MFYDFHPSSFFQGELFIQYPEPKQLRIACQTNFAPIYMADTALLPTITLLMSLPFIRIILKAQNKQYLLLCLPVRHNQLHSLAH